MVMDDRGTARRFSAAYATGALLMAGYACWHYLMGDYARILVPAVLALLMLVAALLRLALAARARLSAYLVLIAGYLMLALELPGIGDAGSLWIGLAPLMTLLLLPLASAMLLNLAMVPIWLILLGDAQLDAELALGFLALMVATNLIPWEQRRQQALVAATDPRDPHCNALTPTALHELLASEFQRTEFLHQPLAVLVIHLPQLEMASEQFGPRTHQTLIDALCREANRCSRRHDFLGRQGPASFWLVLPDTSESGGQLVQQRIMRAVAQTVLVDTGPLQAPTLLCQRLPGETWPHFEQRLIAATRRLADA